MVANRVRRRLRATGIDTFAEYYAFLTSPGGRRRDARVPRRDHDQRDLFLPRHAALRLARRTTFLPEIAAPGRAAEAAPARCGSGRRRAAPARSPTRSPSRCWRKRHLLAGWRINVLGTDLSGAVLAAARAGRYDERAVHLVGPRRAEALLRRGRRRPDAGPSSPRSARWSPGSSHNLLTPLEEEPFDCIFIKNVLIYFDAESKQTVVRERARRPGRRGVPGGRPHRGDLHDAGPARPSQALAVPEAWTG